MDGRRLRKLDPGADEHGDAKSGVAVAAPSPRAPGELAPAEHAARNEERRALELYRAQEGAMLDFLCGAIAHDVNNPLTVIVGMTQLMLESPRLSSERRASLEQIEVAAERAVRLTRGLLAFSRRRTAAPQALDLGAALLELQEPLRQLLAPEVRLQLRVDPDLARVSLDRSQLDQVLVRITSTARQVLRGGTLTLAARGLELSSASSAGAAALEPGAYVELCAEHLGSEQDPRTLQQVSEPFYSAALPELSLCLAFVRAVALHAGGDAWMDGDNVQVARLCMLLPALR